MALQLLCDAAAKNICSEETDFLVLKVQNSEQVNIWQMKWNYGGVEEKMGLLLLHCPWRTVAWCRKWFSIIWRSKQKLTVNNFTYTLKTKSFLNLLINTAWTIAMLTRLSQSICFHTQCWKLAMHSPLKRNIKTHLYTSEMLSYALIQGDSRTIVMQCHWNLKDMQKL